jgi:hypothetical protein
MDVAAPSAAIIKAGADCQPNGKSVNWRFPRSDVAVLSSMWGIFLQDWVKTHFSPIH